jgi:murein DD-endopeptidase MepM/ murein hydrolase activator NlpD
VDDRTIFSCVASVSFPDRRANYRPPYHSQEFELAYPSPQNLIVRPFLIAIPLLLLALALVSGAQALDSTPGDPAPPGAWRGDSAVSFERGPVSAEPMGPSLLELLAGDRRGRRAQRVSNPERISIERFFLRPALSPNDSGGSEHVLTVVTRGTLRPGESLSASLRAQGIATRTIYEIAEVFAGVFDFRRARPGHGYRLAQEAGGGLVDFRYFLDDERSLYLHRTETGYAVREEEAALRPEVVRVSGQIDSSLYGAIKELGERSQLANDFADIFAWDIDFSRSVQPGDDFQILFERLYRTNAEGEEIYARPGRILAARYRGRSAEHSAIYFQDGNGQGSYYRADGSSVERAFLVAPLKFSRISSSFSKARRHPILNIVRPHRGIDYAASHGTPLWSVGAGTVIFRGWAGGSGNLVKIKHRNGYVSYYAHLAGFEPGLKVGSQVEQKQVIGYVGDTGLATGPHVCFRVQKDGRYVNPMEISSPAGEPVTPENRNRFESVRDLLFADMGTGMQMALDEAL